MTIQSSSRGTAKPTDDQHALEELRGRFRSGARLKFVFFWGHQTHDGGISKACLSQWYPAPFLVDGLRFPTAEHFMMYRKAQLFGDEQSAAEILHASNPGAAKAHGRAVRGFDEAVWRRHRSEIAITGNHAKFSQAAPLRDFLLSTKNRVLVEASPVDRIWGIGMAADDPHAENPLEWRGLNLLGFALMEARERLL